MDTQLVADRTCVERIRAAHLWTQERRDESGRLLWAPMMHADALGSSRLLLRRDLLATVGGEYRVGIPDRSCALVIPVSAGP